MARDPKASRKAASAKAQARARARRAARIRRAQWTALVLVAIALLGVVLFRSSGGGAAINGVAAVGQPVPDIEMTDFDGEKFSLKEYRGKPLVLNFWASWCPNCAAEMPDFERVNAAAEGDVEFLGVNQSDSRSSAEDLAHATNVTYRLSEDPTGEVFRAFGGTGMPTTVFIDADGDVADIVVGQLSREQLEDYIQRSFGVTVDA